MKKNKLALTLSILLMLLGCQANANQPNKKPVINISDRKSFNEGYLSQVNSLDFFDDRGLISLTAGNILSLDNQQIKITDSIKGNDASNISLNSNGDGVIFYISGLAYLSDNGSIKNKLYLSKVKNFNLTEKDIVIDDQLNTANTTISSIDKDGNGLIIYQRDRPYFIRLVVSNIHL